jgi:hypothetical protein
VKVTMILADVARVSEGKLDVLGGGWSVTGPDPSPSAIGLIIEVPWAQTGVTHPFELVLMTDAGAPVPGPNGDPLARFAGELETARPPGVLLGGPFVIPLALNIPPLPLDPGSRYRWTLTVDGNPNVDWELSFSTRPAHSRQPG